MDFRKQQKNVISKVIQHKDTRGKEWWKYGQNPLNLINQTRMILKKDLFSDLEILEMCGQASCEYTQKSLKLGEKQNIESQNITKSIPPTWTFTQERKFEELISKIIT